MRDCVSAATEELWGTTVLASGVWALFVTIFGPDPGSIISVITGSFNSFSLLVFTSISVCSRAVPLSLLAGFDDYCLRSGGKRHLEACRISGARQHVQVYQVVFAGAAAKGKEADQIRDRTLARANVVCRLSLASSVYRRVPNSSPSRLSSTRSLASTDSWPSLPVTNCHSFNYQHTSTRSPFSLLSPSSSLTSENKVPSSA